MKPLTIVINSSAAAPCGRRCAGRPDMTLKPAAACRLLASSLEIKKWHLHAEL